MPGVVQCGVVSRVCGQWFHQASRVRCEETYFSLFFFLDYEFWQVSVGKADAWMDAKGEQEADLNGSRPVRSACLG